MPRIPWTSMTWSFDEPTDLYPLVLERLRGTPARIAWCVLGLSTDDLKRRDGDSWSIQENIGHILDLEVLPAGRLDDFLSGAETLRAADMSNTATWDANHNTDSIEDLIAEFDSVRGALIDRLDALEPADFGRTALHPRLNTPMRIVDMCRFQADHDDYHLARVNELRELWDC